MVTKVYAPLLAFSLFLKINVDFVLEFDRLQGGSRSVISVRKFDNYPTQFLYKKFSYARTT